MIALKEVKQKRREIVNYQALLPNLNTIVGRISITTKKKGVYNKHWRNSLRTYWNWDGER